MTTTPIAPAPINLEPIYIAGFAEASAEDLASVPWGTHTEARQECFMALTPTEYTYGSGRGVRTYSSRPYLPWVEQVRVALNSIDIAGAFASYPSKACSYNVCFLNRYEDAGQHLGWHADDSPGMQHDHPISVVSFGQAREIWWRRNGQTGVIPENQRRLLEPGSLFVMPAGFQLDYQHKIPKGDRKMVPRASLTFRHYVPVEVKLTLTEAENRYKDMVMNYDAEHDF